MKILGIIPARIGSTRLSRKPLADINGKTLIQRTYESCKKSQLVKDFIVATDSQEIFEHVDKFGRCHLTTHDHQSGTSRIIEVAELLNDYDYYLNIQGDHPNLLAEHIDSLAVSLLSNSENKIVTPIIKLTDGEELLNPSVVKVVFNKKSEALYFSRQPLPYIRGVEQTDWFDSYVFYKHLGLYGFTKDTLMQIKKLHHSKIEIAESLEQLTWLYEGYKITCVEVDNDVMAIDTPEDLEKIRKILC